MNESTPKPPWWLAAGKTAAGVIRRFRFAFSLRTLFVAVTLLSCWLGREAYIVRQRASMRQRIEAAGGVFTEYASLTGPYAQYYNVRVSFVRSLMGDQAVCGVLLPKESSEEEADAVAKQFNEVVRVKKACPN